MTDILCDGFHRGVSVGFGTCLGRAVVGTCLPSETWHIIILELQAFTLFLQHFSLLVCGKDMNMVRSDQCTAMAYINRQVGICSIALLKLAKSLWVWASKHLLSLRALHVPGLENRNANLMSSAMGVGIGCLAAKVQLLQFLLSPFKTCLSLCKKNPTWPLSSPFYSLILCK